MTVPPPPRPEAQAGRLAELERSNRNLSLLLHSAPIPVLLLGPDLRVLHHSAPMADVAQLDSGGPGAALQAIRWSLDMDWLPAAARRVQDGGAAEERTIDAPRLDARYVVRVLPWAAEAGAGVAVALQPLDSAGGVIDQQRCRQALAGMQTLKHQLSNTMLLLRSVIRRSAETADGLEDYVLHLEARLDSIHRILTELVREPQKTFDLGKMIECELEEQGADHAGGAWSLQGPQVAVRATAAQVLGLVFQEMVTNALQHGALGGDQGGQLRVTWSIVEAPGGRQLQLDWSERGEFQPPRRAGFGTTVLESVLPYQLDGHAIRSFDGDGLRVTMTIPLANVASEPGEAFDLF